MTSLCARSYYDSVTEYLDRRGRLRIDPGSLRAPERPEESAGSLEIVVPYTDPEVTAKVVKKAAALAIGLNAMLKLVAVYVAPYPADLTCPAAMEEHLTSRLSEIAGRTSLPSSVQIVVARDRDAGFRHVLRPESVVLMGSLRRLWRTREEKLARVLAFRGHHVSLLHFD
jgi:hypothetical protein